MAPRQIKFPETPEEHSSVIEIFLQTLRLHKKHKEDILDPIFLASVEHYVDDFDMRYRREEKEDSDRVFNAAMDVMQKTSRKIVKTKPTKPLPYITFFEAMVEVMPVGKSCADCKLPFHPVENVDKRQRCVYCM
jgi:hypothetical protein